MFHLLIKYWYILLPLIPFLVFILIYTVQNKRAFSIFVMMSILLERVASSEAASFGLSNANSQEKIDLEGLQPTFEEETDLTDDEKKLQNFEIRSKNKKKIMTGETAIVHFRALDKITAKTSDISIPVGKKQKIIPRWSQNKFKIWNFGTF